MTDSGQPDHLSRISTIWSVVFDSHGSRGKDAEAVRVAQGVMMERYSGTIYRYLLRILRDADAADEVFQQFALNFVRGGFRRVDPERGRFRDYLKVSLLRLVSDYRKTRAAQGCGVPAPVAEIGAEMSGLELDRDFLECCRDELLSRSWQTLQSIERKTGRPFHTVLNYRAQCPDASSEQMAMDMTRELQPERPFTDSFIRKTLQRAREKFSDILLDEVIQSIGTSDKSSVEHETIDLGLHPYCATALQRRYPNEL